MTTRDDNLDDRRGPQPTWTSLDAVHSRYRAHPRRGSPAGIVAVLPESPAELRKKALLALIVEQLRERILAGEPARLEDYLRHFPELGEPHAAPRELVAAEWNARRMMGEAVDTQEYGARFGWDAADVEATLPVATDGPSGDPLQLPPGNLVGDFRIVRLLGEGGHARVYLAHQQSLDRPVALKVAAVRDEEGRTLARLEHPHIVTVFSEHVVRGLKLLAMRYVPGRTLAEWLAERGDLDLTRWRGRDLLQWLSTAAPPSGEPCWGRDARARVGDCERFVPIVCGMIRDLALALAHAHAAGVLHRDVKPANVLIDRDGRVLLMDFHVADRSQPDRARDGEAPLGGTLAYMAPEHLAAFAGIEWESAAQVDERSDLFSLGVVFYELLCGTSPWPLEPARDRRALLQGLLAVRLRPAAPLPTTLPGVSPGLQSMVAKCLASLPEDRYPSANALAEDLDRLLEHRQLLTAADPSLRERTTKWRRRHPRVVAVATALLVAAGALVISLGWSDLRRLARAEASLDSAAVAIDRGDSVAAQRALVDAHVSLVTGHYVIPSHWTHDRQLGVRTRLDRLATSVATAERLRFDALSDRRRTAHWSAGAAALEDPLAVYRVYHEEPWEELPHYASLRLEQRGAIREQVTEFLLVDRMFGPSQRREAAAAEFLRRIPSCDRTLPLVVAVAEGPTSGPCPLAQWARSLPGMTAYEHYLLGVLAAVQGDLSLACEELLLSLRSEPRRFWANFLLAVCWERRDRVEDANVQYLEDAKLRYGACILLRPEFAWPYHNLGLIATRQGDYALAAERLRRAVELDPDLPSAHANLGVSLFQLQQFAAARDALEQAVALGDDSAATLTNRAAARHAMGDLPGARDDLGRALRADPDFTAANRAWELLEAERTEGETPPTTELGF